MRNYRSHIAASCFGLLVAGATHAHPLKAHVVRCTPVDATEAKVELSFYYQSNLKKKKLCKLGTSTEGTEVKKWKDVECQLKDSRKFLEFQVGGEEKPIHVKILKDTSDSAHNEGVIKGIWNKQKIDHSIDCEVILED